MIDKDARKIFEVVEVQQDNNSSWMISGLALGTIAVGDILYISSNLESGGMSYLPIEILRILVFDDRLISMVDIGYYAKIFVAEDLGELVSQIDYLYTI